MMNEEQKIISLLERDKPILKAWGTIVKNESIDGILKRGFSSAEMLKIPVAVRIKNEKSLIEKALYRGKSYKNPYEEITDKAGVRFVVLNLCEVDTITSIVENCNNWKISKDKDFEKEKEEKPEFFTYQSVHYILRNKSEITNDGVLIPISTPCEVQIRTLLQHSYAELSHDIVYKKEKNISPEMRRLFARSMALIETTDELFREVQRMVDTDNLVFYEFVEIFTNTENSDGYVDKINRLIFDAYKQIIEENQVTFMDVKNYIKENDFLYSKVKDSEQLLYRQPIIYLVYYLIVHYKNQARQDWPLTDSELRPLFNHLGIRMGI
jgi:ppGpp synthetase/RelA/SpoT-type nucleotidyltranferase